MTRFKRDGMKPGGIKGVIGVLVAVGHPLDGARARRLKMMPTGASVVELIDEDRDRITPPGLHLTVAPGVFQRRDP